MTSKSSRLEVAKNLLDISASVKDAAAGLLQLEGENKKMGKII
jgi:hypothetical protein